MITKSASQREACNADERREAPDVFGANVHADGLDEPAALVIQKLGHHVHADASSPPGETPNMPEGQGKGLTVPLPGQ